MNQKQQAPGTRSEYAGANRKPDRMGKGSKSLPYHQQRVYDLLSSGGMFSVVDISMRLRLSDPRSIIRNLRRSGISVGDVWVNTAYGSRYKRYFIKRDLAYVWEQ